MAMTSKNTQCVTPLRWSAVKRRRLLFYWEEGGTEEEERGRSRGRRGMTDGRQNLGHRSSGSTQSCQCVCVCVHACVYGKGTPSVCITQMDSKKVINKNKNWMSRLIVCRCNTSLRNASHCFLFLSFCSFSVYFIFYSCLRCRHFHSFLFAQY